ncbi:MAG: putative AB-hydrolase YheT [Streblomastix strix]|uniref:Putative AB-hydrolase YheT n=1 Tax=Streblomastix strix TaxID=222440 RepID=A0A5J4W886_9EUKA|nr:MAG: putative AB-hydrolase YheT [Streblomastix strix]
MASIIINLLLILFVLPFVIYLLVYFHHSGKVEILGSGRKPLQFLKGRKIYYWPHYKYGINGKLNTVASYQYGKTKDYRPRREMLIGYDGGQFAIDWFEDANVIIPDDAPIIVAQHGINGGSSESYLQHIGLRCIREKKWRFVCVIFRGCCGTKLTTLRTYNGGYSEDIHQTIKTINQRYTNSKIFILGYSLGANTITKYLGEQNSKYRPICVYKQVAEHDPVPKQVVAAVSVGNPFDFYAINKVLSFKEQTFIGSGYMKYLNSNMQLMKTHPRIEEIQAIPKGKVQAKDYDEIITAGIFKYENLDQLYIDASSRQFIDGIRIPLLIISTKNDTISLFNPAFDKLARYDILGRDGNENDNVSALVFPSGGHIGLFSAFSTKKRVDEELILQYFQYYLDSHDD